MKKLSRILALSLVMVMVLGMTVFAEGSKDTEIKSGDTDIVEVVSNTVTLSTEQAKELAEAIKTVPSGAASNATPKLEAAFELEAGKNFKAGDNVPVSAPLFKTFDFEKNVYVAYHWVEVNGVGSWTTHEVKGVTGTEQIYIMKVTSFSPFEIYSYPRPVGDSGNTGNTGNTGTTTPPATPQSPQTGETMPVAVVIAMIALAGAAVVGTRKMVAKR